MMPKTSRPGQKGAGELPGTLQRSSGDAQEAVIAARERAVQAHGESDQAYREAYTELKRTFEKRGDHWIAKVQD
jgi:ChaB